MTIRLSTRNDLVLREFQPEHGEAKIYVCGVTPYDAAHLGHIATFLPYDVLVRRLDDLGYRTKLVRNITDLDDPILPRAKKLDISYFDLVEAEIKQFSEDMRRLGMLPPFAEPRASEMLPELVGFIEELVAARTTYQVGGTGFFY